MSLIDELRRKHHLCRRAERCAAFPRIEREYFGRVAEELSRVIQAYEDDRLAKAATASQLASIVVRARQRRSQPLAVAAE